MITTSPIRAARERAGMTQSDLAHAASVSTATVHRIETGRVRPNAATLAALERALHVTPGDLGHGSHDASPAGSRGSIRQGPGRRAEGGHLTGATAGQQGG